ncbi:hypothetical protein [Nocardia africana]|uniref:Uncharacterized protein n=1 Tax=Nocardia africana TaxID=134964 RepID=A0A378X1E6_9NOCA|nr:hypothetical protein [Nocardia africana]MCC3311473.1 hypothetical protein [Nocardia africana]SUA47268.1 Uncharacterised protein [Nocardia africana]
MGLHAAPEEESQPEVIEEPTKWSQTFRHWSITTTISVVGVCIGLIGLIVTLTVNWEKIFDSGPSISMKHEDFTKLAYGQQLDLCIPYLKKNLDSKVEAWRKDIAKAYNDQIPESSDGVAGLDDLNAGGQSILHLYNAILEIAHTSQDADLGLNLVACAATPSSGLQANDIVGNGTSAPYTSMTVDAESRTFEGAVFAGVSSAGLPSKIIKFEAYPGVSVEFQFSMMSGLSRPDNKIWALSRSITQGDPNWIDNLSAW